MSVQTTPPRGSVTVQTWRDLREAQREVLKLLSIGERKQDLSQYSDRDLHPLLERGYIRQEFNHRTIFSITYEGQLLHWWGTLYGGC